MVFVESETEVSFTTKKKMTCQDIFMLSERFTEIGYARRRSDGLLIEFDTDGCFKSATLNDEEKIKGWLWWHDERSYWDIGLRGIEQ